MKQPETSKAAHEQAGELQIKHKARILKAFMILGEATAEQMAKYLGLTHVQVNRRFSELANPKLPLIENTGKKAATESGREAFIWRKKGETVKTEEQKRAIEKELQIKPEPAPKKERAPKVVNHPQQQTFL